MGRIQDIHGEPQDLVVDRVANMVVRWAHAILAARSSHFDSASEGVLIDKTLNSLEACCSQLSEITPTKASTAQTKIYTILQICNIDQRYKSLTESGWDKENVDNHILEEWSIKITRVAEISGDTNDTQENWDKELHSCICSITSLLRILPAHKLHKLHKSQETTAVLPGTNTPFRLHNTDCIHDEDTISEFETAPRQDFDIFTRTHRQHEIHLSVKYRKEFNVDSITGNKSPLSIARRLLALKPYQTPKPPTEAATKPTTQPHEHTRTEGTSPTSSSTSSSSSTFSSASRRSTDSGHTKARTPPIPIQGSPRIPPGDAFNLDATPSSVPTMPSATASYSSSSCQAAALCGSPLARPTLSRSCSEMTPPRHFYCRSPPDAAIGSANGFLNIGGVTIAKTYYSPPSAPEKWAPFVGSFEESILSGRMSNTTSSRYDGFVAELSAHGMGVSNPKIKIPFTAIFYHVHFDAPYVGSIELPGDGLRIPTKGMIQLQIMNPTQTPLKLFLIKYDVPNMMPGTKTFVRQKTLSSTQHGHKVHYAAHLRFFAKAANEVYLHSNIRILFPHRVPDSDTSLTVVHEQGPIQKARRKSAPSTKSALALSSPSTLVNTADEPTLPQSDQTDQTDQTDQGGFMSNESVLH